MNIKFISMTSLALSIFLLAGCSHKSDDINLKYEPDTYTTQADTYFKDENINELNTLCKTMGNDIENIDKRVNFLNYISAKTTDIAENQISKEYKIALNVIETALKTPISSNEIINQLKVNYNTIDSLLTEETKKYIIGKWKRADTTDFAGAIIDVSYNDEDGFVAKITKLPPSKTGFDLYDVKWTNIVFANNSKFYFSDLSVVNVPGTQTVKEVYNGADGIIDFNNDTITVLYDRKNSVDDGEKQIWVKVGTKYENHIFEVEDKKEEKEKQKYTINSDGYIVDLKGNLMVDNNNELISGDLVNSDGYLTDGKGNLILDENREPIYVIIPENSTFMAYSLGNN